MKVLILNGSPRKNGNTAAAIDELVKVFDREEIETEVISVGGMTIRGCMSCNSCAKTGRCAIDDIVNKVAPKFEEADGLIVASPVYYASPNSTLTALLDRLFYSTLFDKTMKVGASVVIARRGGCSAAFDQLNKYFTISGMPVASSTYWNSVHGCMPGEAVCDTEGMAVMRGLARNMAFLIKSISIGLMTFGYPEKEKYPATNFIRSDLAEANAKKTKAAARKKPAAVKALAEKEKKTAQARVQKPTADQVKPSVIRAVSRAKKAAEKAAEKEAAAIRKAKAKKAQQTKNRRRKNG